MLILSGADVRSLLTPRHAYEAALAAMQSLRSSTTYQPVRTHLAPPGISGMTLLKPAAIDGAYGLKVASLFPGNVERGLPTITGFVLLLDAQTGQPAAIIDAASLTELRTAAVSAVATTALARPDASRLALIGSGAQARAHLLAIAAERSLEEVRVASPQHAGELASWAGERGIRVIVSSAEDAVRNSDIVCTLTTSSVPVLSSDWVGDGTHINAVGAFRAGDRELDTATVVRARVYVDQLDAARAEAGALLIAQAEGAIRFDEHVRELTDVLIGAGPGRDAASDVTAFCSTGLAIQDVATAAAVVQEATTRGVGVEVDLTG